MTTCLGRVLTSGRNFSTQTLKSSRLFVNFAIAVVHLFNPSQTCSIHVIKFLKIYPDQIIKSLSESNVIVELFSIKSHYDIIILLSGVAKWFYSYACSHHFITPLSK